MDLTLLELEREHGFPNRNIIGVDEVGRGCIAGPVVAVAVLLPEDAFLLESESLRLKPEWGWLRDVRDSKKMTEREREEVYERANEARVLWASAEASVQEIDSLNILWASMLAMERAVAGIEVGGRVLVDGNRVPSALGERGVSVVKGDARSLAIALASVLAKVTRDRMMDQFGTEWSEYGLETHKGYPTPKHLEAIDRFGVLEIHRKTFGPVRSRLLARDMQVPSGHERENTF